MSSSSPDLTSFSTNLPCENNDHCETGTTCLATGFCGICEKNTDCKDHFVCIASMLGPGRTTNGHCDLCREDDDCEPGEFCLENYKCGKKGGTEEEDAKKEAEEKKKAEEEDVKKKEEDEDRKKEEEADNNKTEEEADKNKTEEEANKNNTEDEAEKKKEEEEEAKKKAEEEEADSKAKAEEWADQKNAEVEAAQKKAAEEFAKNKTEVEAAMKREEDAIAEGVTNSTAGQFPNLEPFHSLPPLPPFPQDHETSSFPPLPPFPQEGFPGQQFNPFFGGQAPELQPPGGTPPDMLSNGSYGVTNTNNTWADGFTNSTDEVVNSIVADFYKPKHLPGTEDLNGIDQFRQFVPPPQPPPYLDQIGNGYIGEVGR